MMISTKGRYALRILVDIAEHQGDGYVPLKESADRQEISEKYRGPARQGGRLQAWPAGRADCYL